VSHYEYPPKCCRSIDSEADIKPPCPQGLVARARELEEIVAQHANRTESDGDEDREHRFFHRRVATPIPRLTPLSF
jgi:hypothetical protein